MKEHNIFTVGIEHPVAKDVRVPPPDLPTPRAHVDLLVTALQAAAKRFG
jgi:hypothetical protein